MLWNVLYLYYLSDCVDHVTNRGELSTNGDVVANAYYGCQNLRVLYIGDTTKNIASGAFSNTALTHVFGGTSDTNIHQNAFDNIPKSLRLSCSLCTINNRAFTSKNIRVVSSIKTIRSGAFTEKITFDPNVSINGIIEPYAFETDNPMHIGNLHQSYLILNVNHIIVQNVETNVVFTLVSNANVYIENEIADNVMIRSVNNITIHVTNICDGSKFNLTNINLVCENGVTNTFTGEGSDLIIKQGLFHPTTKIEQNFKTLSIGTTTSRNIGGVSTQMLSVYLFVDTVYISSCVDIVFGLNDFKRSYQNTSGLNFTNGLTHPVIDICTPCAKGYYFNVETETGKGGCKKCTGTCSRNHRVVVHCEGEINLLCEECPAGYITPDNSLLDRCIKHDTESKRVSLKDIVYISIVSLSSVVLIYVFYNIYDRKNK